MRIILLLVCIMCMIAANNALLVSLNNQLEVQRLEGICINKYINMGIPRKDIYPANGTCVVKHKKGQHRR